MNRILLLLSVLFLVHRISAQIILQQFTGTVSSYGYSGGTGFFGTPVGTQVSGSFTVTTGNLGTPVMTSVGTEWSQSLLNGKGIVKNNVDSISAASPNGSFSASNLQSVIIGETYRADTQYGGGPLASGAAGGLAILCQNSPSLPTDLSAFPLVTPSGCTAEVSFNLDGNQSFITIDLTSLSGISIGAIQTVDPTAGLMSGNSVNPSRPALATGGRAVQGIAADGSAEILLRIPVQTAGDTVTATVLSDQCSTVNEPSSCETDSASHDGGLLTLANSSDPSKPLSTAMDTSQENSFAYLIYRAPADFVRDPGVSPDASLTSRGVQFQVSYTSANGQNYGTVFLPLTIIRPPTVLIHGYATNAHDTWTDFTTVTNDTRTTVYQPDYGDPITVSSTNPPLGCTSTKCQTVFKNSDLGFVYNTPAVASDILVRLGDFAAGENPLKLPVAVSQFDVVAHSMGGLIARYWTTEPPGVPFFTSNNFGQGYIHKMVTIATPHYGSPLATISLSPNAGCFRAMSSLAGTTTTQPLPPFIVSKARYEISTAVLADGKTTVTGAVGDLDGDGIGSRLNPNLLRVKEKAAPLWLVAIAGDAKASPLSYLLNLINDTCNHYTAGLANPDPVASRYTSSRFSTLFDPDLSLTNEAGSGAAPSNDGAVPGNSALFDTLCVPSADATVSPKICFAGYAHGKGTSFLISNGATMYLTDGTGTVATFVEQVLNTSLDDTSVWAKQ